MSLVWIDKYIIVFSDKKKSFQKDITLDINVLWPKKKKKNIRESKVKKATFWNFTFSLTFLHGA